MINFGADGLTIDTFETILAEVQAGFRTAFGSIIATKVTSSAGQLQNLIALRESQLQEKLLQVYQGTDPRLAEGVILDQRNSLLGIDREPDDQAEVLGTASGTPATAINDGVRVQVGSFVFEVVDGPYVIGGGGTIGSVRVRAQEPGEVDVTLLGAWTILDSVAGFVSFDDDSQPNAGRVVESDAEYRARAEIERYRRSSGPLAAIEASVSSIDEVSYVRAYHNITTDPTDANGIPLWAINVVVEGGDAAEVAAAIFAGGPAGHLFFGTDESEDVPDGVGGTVSIGFDRVDSISLYVRATLTTSTSEETAPDDLEALVRTTLLAYTAANWSIGTDVLVHKLSGSLASIVGVDAVLIETSLDGVAWSTAKRSISIRQRAVLTDGRITFVEN